jgi:hypothetical protein
MSPRFRRALLAGQIRRAREREIAALMVVAGFCGVLGLGLFLAALVRLFGG